MSSFVVILILHVIKFKLERISLCLYANSSSPGLAFRNHSFCGSYTRDQILIRLPISAYVMSQWLEEFSYRIQVDAWTLALAALIAVVIAILTVSYQSLKTSISNPVDSLRSE